MAKVNKLPPIRKPLAHKGIPNLNEIRDIKIVDDLRVWLVTERATLENQFRVSTNHETTCKLQGRVSLVDELLSKFSNHKKDDNYEQDRTREDNEYDC